MNKSVVPYASTGLVPVLGQDGAQTFFNTSFNEAYHSTIGPILEAEHKFVKASSIDLLLKENKKIKILDLFFGLGYNSGVALDYAYKISPSPIIEITAVEKDPKIINKISTLEVPQWYLKWRDLLSLLSKQKQITHEKIVINLYLDSVLNVLEELPKEYFDVIFFDPFSHKTTPEFWADEFLIRIFGLLANNGTLTTYSGLKRVEKLANDLGFKSEHISPLGRKKHSLAIKKVN